VSLVVNKEIKEQVHENSGAIRGKSANSLGSFAGFSDSVNLSCSRVLKDQ
jgi:hypothetical protein